MKRHICIVVFYFINQKIYKKIGIDYNRLVIALEELTTPREQEISLKFT